MKNYIFILLFILISVGCARKQRYDEGVAYGNYLGREILNIKVDCPFLTDEQFNQAILDTAKIYKLDRNTGIPILKAIQRLDYKHRWYEPDLDIYHRRQIEDSTMSIYCMGRLNLQPNVNSLLIVKSYYEPYLSNDYINFLWLINIDAKYNYINSVIALISLVRNCKPLYPSISLKNKIFKKTRMEEDYWFYNNLGQRFPRKKDKELFSTFTINEFGFFEFTKD